MDDIPPDIQADLTALADGSLAPGRRARVLAQVEDSPELAAALAEQQRAVELVRSVTVGAPASLHRRLQGLRASRRRSLALRPGFAIAAAAAAAVAVLLLSLTGGSSPALTLRQAAALTLRPATMAAPAESPAHRAQLAESVEGIAFPYWEERFGWRSTGARTDRMTGHSITTVFYSDDHGRRIGYSIIAGTPPSVHGGTTIWRTGVPYRLLVQGGTRLVTWLHAGHACVVSGRGMDAQTLLRLASWSENRALAA